LDPRIAGSNPAEGHRFIRGVKTLSTSSSELEIKPSDLCCKILGMLKIHSKCEERYFVRPNLSSPSQVPPVLLLDDCWQDFQRALVDKSGFSPADITPQEFPVLACHLGVNNRPVDGRSSQTQSHPIDMIITMITVLHKRMLWYIKSKQTEKELIN
jgi:hypothetical protein